VRPARLLASGLVVVAAAVACACRGNVPEEPPRTPPNSPVPEIEKTSDPATGTIADAGSSATPSTTPDAVREPKK
jgi:hypothetical protein